MARFTPKIKPAFIGTWALPGLSDAARDSVPVVRSRVGKCSACGLDGRLPVGVAGAVCSRCAP